MGLGQEREGTKVLWLRILRSKRRVPCLVRKGRLFEVAASHRVGQALVDRVGNPISFFVCF